jgi:hypothetical protein
MDSNKRKFERRQIDREAIIETDELIILCQLLDLSRSGARLRLLESATVPQQFVLNISDKLRPLARIAWRSSDNEFGVEFVPGAEAGAQRPAKFGVFMRCPETHSEIHTGIELRSVGDLENLPNARRFTRCPHCKVVHGWLPTEAFLR